MQIEFIGEGALTRVGDIIAEHQAKKVALVVGKSSYSTSGAQAVLAPILMPLEVLTLEQASPLPLEEDIATLALTLAQFAPDLVLAIGGGHVMDVAKAANARATSAPLVTVPTTAGSGAESTPFAVAYKDGVKMSLEGPEFLPAYAVVDPLLIASTPRLPMVASALDALAQAMESHWSRRATEESRALSQEAMRLVWQSIVQAIENKEKSALSDLARGAHLAGKAIAIAKTTACHAFSYGLTAQYGVPHGVAVAVFLPSMMRFNGASFGDITPEATEALLERLQVPRLSAFGVPRDAIHGLATEVNAERLGNNPRSMTQEDITMVYTTVWNQYLN